MVSEIHNDTSLGIVAEKLVSDYLLQQGATIIATNFRVRGGEIDIVAQQGNALLFVEVKGRAHDTEHIFSLVPLSKQRKIIHAALHIISTYPDTNRIYRFDVALVIPVNGKMAITYIPNAFQASLHNGGVV